MRSFRVKNLLVILLLISINLNIVYAETTETTNVYYPIQMTCIGRHLPMLYGWAESFINDGIIFDCKTDKLGNIIGGRSYITVISDDPNDVIFSEDGSSSNPEIITLFSYKNPKPEYAKHVGTYSIIRADGECTLSFKYLEDGEEKSFGMKVKIENYTAGIPILINGLQLYSDTASIIKNNRVLVPIRMLESLGYNIDWNGDKREVTIRDKDELDRTIIKLVIDSTIANVDGKNIDLDIVPEIIQDRTMVPLRFISENTGVNLNCDDNLKAVFIEE